MRNLVITDNAVETIEVIFDGTRYAIKQRTKNSLLYPLKLIILNPKEADRLANFIKNRVTTEEVFEALLDRMNTERII